MVSLTTVSMLESRFTKEKMPHPFYPIAWKGTWWPMLAALCMHRGVIIALAQPINYNVHAAYIRFLGHAACCIVGYLLYSWMLQHQSPVGLPPLHQWWAKVLMYFNLCVAIMHLLPLPGMLVGELLSRSGWYSPVYYTMAQHYQVWLWLLLSLSPLLDLFPGTYLIYPIYEWLISQAMA